ncbi:MAG: bile acid:sodium symporter family protein [Brumimicrobium sp.]
MESSIITEVFLPGALAIIMLGMGLSLALGDFKRLFKHPKAILTGLLNQLVLLPVIGFSIMYFFELPPVYAVGVILIAACPGGATSNLLTFMAKGDAALSISLTAFSSLITIFTIPFIVNLAMKIYFGAGQYVALPVFQTILQIMIITVVPVSIGMFIKSRSPKTALKFEKAVKIASGILITVVIFGAIIKQKDEIIPAFQQVGLPILILNLVTIFVGFYSAKLFGLNFRQSSTVSIESGIQNGTLAIAIAAGATLLDNPQMAIPPAVYSILMFISGALVVYWYGKKNGKRVN